MCLCCAGQTHLTTQWMDERSLDCRPPLHKVNQQRKSSHTDKCGLACLLHCIPLHWPATDVNDGHVDKLCLAKPMATPRAVFCTHDTCIANQHAIVAHSHSPSRHRHHYHSLRVAPHPPPSRWQSPSRQAAWLIKQRAVTHTHRQRHCRD